MLRARDAARIYLNGAIPPAVLRAGLGMKRAEIDRKFDETCPERSRSKRAFTCTAPNAVRCMCARAVAPNACPERSRRNAHHFAARDPSAASGQALEGNVLESPEVFLRRLEAGGWRLEVEEPFTNRFDFIGDDIAEGGVALALLMANLVFLAEIFYADYSIGHKS